MDHSFLIHDTETSGLIPSFDQIFQFAAVRADKDLHVSEEHNFLIRPRPDVIPSAMAQVTHKIPLKLSMAKGISEYEAAKKISVILNRPGTISIGYNSMVFDSEMLRFMLYRNLLDPYAHQFQNGCKQMDVLPMLVFCFLYRPELFKWPKTIDGKVSFKLEDIALENGFRCDCEKAHDALADVKAVARLIKILKTDSKLWDYLAGFFDGQNDLSRMNALPVVLRSNFKGMSRIKHYAGLHLSSRHKDQNCQASVLYIGNSIAYPKQSLWLRIDLPDFQSMTVNNFMDKACVLRKKAGNADFIVPANEKFNALSPEIKRLAQKNLKWILDQPELFEQILHYFRQYQYPCPTNDLDEDAALYGGPFPTNRDKMFCLQFHKADRVEDKLNVPFPRPLHQELAKRIVWRNFSQYRNEQVQKSYKNMMGKIFGPDPVYDYKGTIRLTPGEAMTQIGVARLENDLDAEQKRMLDELESYVRKTFLNARGNDCIFEASQSSSLIKNYWKIVAQLIQNSGKRPVPQMV